jgi:hypothetical protein
LWLAPTVHDGKARFSIAPDKSKLIRVKLNRRGKRLLANARRRHRLKGEAEGRGVRARAVLVRRG